MASIIIPAHNEESVIGVSLATLIAGLDTTHTKIVVVCNGCTDATASVAKGIDGSVEVIEIDRASKTNALNVGDSVSSTYPRIYLDADVEIDSNSVLRLIAELQNTDASAAEPCIRIDTGRSSALVRAYYAVWTGLHGQSPGDIGGGVYALSSEGRSRFGPFPNVIADDAYVRAHFGSDDLIRVEGATSVVYAPERIEDLLQIKTRSRLGIMELQEKYPNLWNRKTVQTQSLAAKARGLPLRLWPLAPIYAVIQLLAKSRARRLAGDFDSYTWQRDESSRKHR